MPRKIKLLSYIFLCGFFLVWVRVIYLQLFGYRQLKQSASNQYQTRNIIMPKRGNIITSNGDILAKSIATSSANQFTRFYPQGSQSAFLTGFVGKDVDGQNLGYFGLEGFFDRQLRGKEGLVKQETDVFNRPILIGDLSSFPAQDGQDIVTSFDLTLQYFLSEALKEALPKYQAEGGSIILMESNTGKILAMVDSESYDPNIYWTYSNQDFTNRLVTAAYEPGSTFKPLVMAMALNDKVINLNTICDVCNRPMQIGEWTIKSYNDKYYANNSLYDIILHSDNVGMAFISKKLGKKRLISYLKDLNFGQKTGIELQEESTPPLKSDKDWYEIDLATAAFGQGIAVTRLQMVSAINVLANRGIYVSPTVLVDDKTKKSKRVYSSTVVESVVNMMVNGVEKGEVRYYKPKGYTIAGKTGTAQVPIAGNYDETRVISSFVGFAPAHKPKFTMLVTLDNPKSSPWGSQTAAPLWFSLSQKIFTYYQIPPDN